MKNTAAVAFLLFLGSIAAAAQNAGQPPKQTALATGAKAEGSCPVSLHAQQRAAGDMMEASKSRPKGIAQLLHLTLTHSDSRHISQVTVTVRGVDGKPHVEQTPSASEGSPEAAKTLNVSFPAGPDKELTADLWVPGLTAVKTISVESITYADGSVWKLAGGDSCRTWIDGVMPIRSR